MVPFEGHLGSVKALPALEVGHVDNVHLVYHINVFGVAAEQNHQHRHGFVPQCSKVRLPVPLHDTGPEELTYRRQVECWSSL